MNHEREVMKKPDKEFRRLINGFRQNPDVIGAFLTGSRGKGFESQDSDYDLYVIVKDRATARFKKKFQSFAFKGIDLMAYPIGAFEKYASFGGADDWDRYSFLHVKPLFDRS